jgi:very-short-patch-repair endonuclease
VNHDSSIAELATKQHGVFSRSQAMACGVGHKLISRRVRAAVWRLRTSRVLGLCGAPDSDRAQLMTAILHVGGGAVASHRSAAALLGLPGFTLADVHVTRPGTHGVDAAPFGVVHRAPVEGFTTVVDGIPVTTVARTLFDLAATEHPRRVERALDNALATRLTSVSALDLLVRGSRGRTGVKLMRSLVEARRGAYVPPASELEARFLELVRTAGLPEPERQVAVGGDTQAGRVDMVWRDRQLVAELDSWRHHSALLDAQEDVRRDVAAASGGWRVLRVTWEDVFAYPDRTMVRLTAALDDPAMRLRAG